jgi:Rod binding domain-containing protein
MRIADVSPSILAPVSQAPTSKPSPRLVNAAHEFEAALVAELLKPMQQDALFSDNGDNAGDSGSQGSLRSFGTEAIARSISDHGGLGIARVVLERLATKDQTGEAAGKPMSAGRA